MAFRNRTSLLATCLGVYACFVATIIGIWLPPAGVVADERVEFNRDIRPILSDKCFYCHGQDANKREGDLRLDVRQSALDTGAILPANVQDSKLVQRIFSDDPDQQMPPANSNRKLSDQQKNLLKQWIAQGAMYETHWAFEKPVRSQVPEVQNPSWPRNPIDRFVLAKLESVGLQPAPFADRATLIKRLSIDLLGLPPTPAEVTAFVNDPNEDAYERLVERLLSSPAYGQRLALPWLDAARYADSNGFQQDGDTWQWIWRDWVVEALNNDLPFDEFTIWQLAGDLIPNATTEQKIASGFNRNHLLNGEGGAIAEEQRFVNLFDRIDTTATNWLGLTMACAQCHDHKYDPLTKVDYYSLLDAFNRVSETGVPQRQSSRIRVGSPFLELPTEENKAKLSELETEMKSLESEATPVIDAAFAAWRAGLFADGEPADGQDLPRNLTPLLRKPEAERTEADKKSIESQLRKFFDDKVKQEVIAKLPQVNRYDAAKRKYEEYKGDQIPRVMIMADDKPRETFVLDRGEYLKPLDKVTFSVPKFLPPLQEGAPENRLGFARWLVAPEHPLTSRVQVNRIWQHFFGAGIVKSTEDFGVQSAYPIHKELLDWLAVEFRECGWSSKRLHYLIVTSATYRQSSRVTEQHLRVDADNSLYSRASRFRMPALLLRDWALATAGLIDLRQGGQPVYPYQPDDVWEALAITKERDFTYPTSKGGDLFRRSLYTFWRRTVGPSNMFDAANRQTCRVRLATTSTPLHALTTLNDPTWVEAARMLAAKVSRTEATLDARIRAAFESVLCRAPSNREAQQLQSAYEQQLGIFQSDEVSAKKLLAVGTLSFDAGSNAVEQAALTTVCLAILNLDESLTRE